MKMPTMNFDFGPFTESGVVALSPYGIAVRSSKGEYLTYNAATGATVDVTGFTFDFQKMIYKMPAAIKDLRAGDMFQIMTVNIFLLRMILSRYLNYMVLVSLS